MHIVLDEPITSKLLLSIVKVYVDFTGEEERVFLAHHNYIYTMLLLVFIHPLDGLDSCLHGSSCLLHFLKTTLRHFPGDPVAKTLLPMQGTLVQSLFGELGSIHSN